MMTNGVQWRLNSMNKVFYHYLVPIDDSVSLLENTELLDGEKAKLIDIIHSIYDHKIVEIILSNIPIDHHERFIGMLAVDPSDIEIISYLKSHNSEIDNIIQNTGKEIHQEIIAMIHI
jgi:hypothetical protein